jgi:hypothetical protein
MFGLEWITFETSLRWLGIASLLTFFISLALIPWLISRLPVDYFVRPHPFRHPFSTGSGLLFPLWFVLRNIAGGGVLVAGIAMLFLPGQGILTIILGIALMSFPGKYRLLFALTTKPSVQHSLDWIRTKTGRPKFVLRSGVGR